MTAWQDFWGQIALHTARCACPLRTATDRDAAGVVGIIALCPACHWHAIVLLHPGEYPLDDAPAAPAAQPRKDG